MLRVLSHKIVQSSLPENIQPKITPKESSIFDYIGTVCQSIPILSEGKITTPAVARVAGGWIRDKLLRQLHPELDISEPKDLDIALDIMNGDQFAEYLTRYDRVMGTQRFTQGQSRGETANKIGVRFCQIDGEDVEFLQLRTESYGDTRHQITTNIGTPEEDAVRRDLTINAMYYNLITRQIEDYTGRGYNDLAELILRTPSRNYQDYTKGKFANVPPNLTEDQWLDFEIHRVYKEDPIRVLRILRFLSRWPGAKIEDRCVQGMKHPVIRERLTRKLHNKSLSKDDPGVAPEMVGQELMKVMAGKQPDVAVDYMYHTGIMRDILHLPEQNTGGTYYNYDQFSQSQLNPHHELSFLEHTKQVMHQTVQACTRNNLTGWYRAMLVMSAWLHDIGKIEQTHQKWHREPQGDDPGHRMYPGHENFSAEVWERFSENVKLPNREQSFGRALISAHMQPHKLVDTTAKKIKASPSTVAEFMRRNPQWHFVLILAEADSLSKSKESDPEIGKLYEKLRREIIPGLPGLAKNENRNPDQVGFNKDWADSQYIWPVILKPGEIIQIIDPAHSLPVKPSAYLPIVQEAIEDYQHRMTEQKTINQQKQEVIALVQNIRPRILKMFGPKAFDGRAGQVIMNLPEYAHLGPGRHIGIIAERVQQMLYTNPKLSLSQQIEIARAMAPEFTSSV